MKKIILLMLLNYRRHLGLSRCLLTLMLILVSGIAMSQVVIKGNAIDEAGEGIPGVSVLIKGTTIGTSTDSKGYYALSIPEGDDKSIVVFSFIGYETKEQLIGSRSIIDITMTRSLETLNEVVVVGYGTQKKRDVTGAITSVSADVLKETAAPNVFAQLKGHAAGVDVVSNSSTPGGSSQIRIRGNRSLATSNNSLDALDQPLLVVDGIPYGGSINDISPTDIASLEILKDASATAIYGSRGSGGVILITTKRGKSGKSVISYDAYYGISEIMGKLKVYDGPGYAALKAEAAAGNTATPGTTLFALSPSEQAALDAGVSTDWQDQVYKRGHISSHNIGLSGGNETAQYSLGTAYFKETGIIPNQNFERFSLRGTIDDQVNKRIKIGLNTLNTVSFSRIPGGSGIPQGLMKLTPLASPYNADGSLNLLPQSEQIDNLVVNPITLKSKPEGILNKTRRLRTFNSLYGEVEIVKGLKYRINVGLDYRQQQQDTYEGPSTWSNTSPSPAQSRASIRNQEAWTYTIENLLNYEKTIAEKHRLGVTALFSVQKDHAQNTGAFGLGIPADYIQNTNLALASSSFTAINPQNPNDNPNSFSERGLVSYMGRATYGFDRRLSLTATVRVDGSSVLSPGHQFFVYPAFAGAWNLSNEKFMQNISILSNLKLRAGWGKTSNQGIDPYSTLGSLDSKYYNFGQGTDGQQIAYLVTQLANNSLKWQSTSQYNFGFEFGLLNDRITGVVDVYQARTKDILLSVGLPPSNGALSTVSNLGKTKTSGLEITLSSTNLKTQSGLTWTTDLNYFFNREEIVQLTTADEKSNISNGWFVGQPLTVIYDYKKVGIWQLEDETSGALAAQTSPKQFPGQIKVEDIAGPIDPATGKPTPPDGKITPDDRQVIGNFQPKWEGGLTNKVSFKNVDLSISIYARMGMKMLVPYVTTDGSSNGYTFFNQGRNNQLVTDYWTPTNPTNAFPRPDASTDRLLYSSTLGYMDGSFIKCRTINLGYTIPSVILGKARISSLRIYVSAVNPFVIYSPFVKGGFGPDPEGNGYGGAIQPQGGGNLIGLNRQISVNANNPSTKQFVMGLNLRF